jgi:hypothetical protein
MRRVTCGGVDVLTIENMHPTPAQWLCCLHSKHVLLQSILCRHHRRCVTRSGGKKRCVRWKNECATQPRQSLHLDENATAVGDLMTRSSHDSFGYAIARLKLSACALLVPRHFKIVASPPTHPNDSPGTPLHPSGQAKAWLGSVVDTCKLSSLGVSTLATRQHNGQCSRHAPKRAKSPTTMYLAVGHP